MPPQMALVLDADGKAALVEVDKVEKKFGKLRRQIKTTADKAKANFGRINRGAQTLGAGVKRAMNIAKFALIGLAIASVAVGATFEQSMANVQSVAGATDKELQALSNTARYWGERTAFSANEAADAMYSLASAGLKTAQIQKSVGGVLLYAGATATDLGSAAEATVQALKMFNMEARETDRVVNVMAAGISASMLNSNRLKEALAQVGATAHATGMDLEHTVSALGTLHNAGQLGSLAGTRLKRVLVELASPNATLRDLLGDVSYTGNNLAEVMEHLRQKGADVSDVFGAFGKISGPAVLSLMSAGGAAMEEMTGKVTNTQKAFEMYEIQMNTVQSQFKIMKSAIQENMIAAFMALKPAIDKSIGYMLQMVQKAKPYIIGFAQTISDWVVNNGEAIKTTAILAAKVLAGAAALSILGSVAIKVKAIFDVLWGTMQIGGMVMKGLGKGFVGLAKGMKFGFVGIVKVAKNAWFLIQYAAASAMQSTLVQGAIMKVKMIANWVAIHVAALGPWGLLVGIAAAVIAGLIILMVKYKDKTMEILRAIGGFFTTLWNGIKSGAEWAANAACAALSLIAPGLGAGLIKAGEAAGNFFTGLYSVAKDKGSAAFNLVGDTIEKLKTQIADAMQSMKDLGSGSVEINIDTDGSQEQKAVFMHGLHAIGAMMDQHRQTQLEKDIAYFNTRADFEKSKLIETEGLAALHTKKWLEARMTLIVDNFDEERNKAGITQAEIAELRVQAAHDIAQAEMDYQDAVLDHWMQNNQAILAGLFVLEAGYNTFFDTITDMEMSGKKRREMIWESMKRSFVRITSDMLKQYIINKLKSIVLAKAAETAANLKTKIIDSKMGARRSYAAYAAVPIIGPALGAKAAATAFAMLMAFHQGGWTGRGNGQGEFLARMVPDEYVIKPSSARSLGGQNLDYMNTYGRIPPSQTNVISLSFSVTGGGVDEEELREAVEDEVLPIIKRAIKSGVANLGAA